MASGSTAIWGRPYPVTGDAPSVHTDIQALANSLETTPLYPTTATSSRSGVAGESVAVSPSQTLTLPASPTKGDTLQVLALGTVTGATPVTVATAGGKVVNGLGMSAVSSFLLGAPNSSVKLQYDGTAWRVIDGGQDSGWVAVTRGTNISAGNPSPQARLIGDKVVLKGAIQTTNVISASATVLTSPFTSPWNSGMVWPIYPAGGTSAIIDFTGSTGVFAVGGASLPNSQTYYLEPTTYYIS